MLFSTTLACLGLLASTALAAPSNVAAYKLSSRQAAGAQNVVYWGQNGGGIVENNDLSAYCASNSGIDILVLAFLYDFGNGDEIAHGTIGQSCFIASSGEGQQCDALAAAIETCKSAGVKIILSLGGESGSWSLSSQTEAQTIGQNLWEAFGNLGGVNGSVPRPFGDTFVNGFDFDLESNNGNEYFQYMISTLRTSFASDPTNTYYITGAPQCPIPEPNMGEIISSSQFDYLWVQFYNNNNYSADPCSLGFGGNAPFNYDNWVSTIAGTPSANAKIFIGVPAAPLGANGNPSGETYYITPDQLATLVEEYKSNSAFGGIMMWAAGFSDSNVNNGCTYAQEAHSILTTGGPCGASGPPPPVSTSTTAKATATSTSAKSTATGTVPQYGQCGGTGYTGPTQCVAPYTCVANSSWWAECQ